MRILGLSLSFAVVVLLGGVCVAGERLPDVSKLPVGFKYCPAPGADNSEFNSSYYAVDARTGQMSRIVDGQPRHDLEPVDTEEKVLFVAPPVDVTNRYVPYPGAAPQEPPAAFANSNHGDYYGNQGYRGERQEYAHNGRVQPEARRPWWKKVLR